MKKQEFYQLILSRKKPLKSIAQQFTHDENEADELVEGTLLRAIADLQSYKTDISINGWLYAIMKNRFIQKYKRLVRAANGVRSNDALFKNISHSCVLNKYKFKTSDITNLLLNHKVNGLQPFSTFKSVNSDTVKH